MNGSFRTGGILVSSFFALLQFAALSAFAAGPLFPQPLHLTRVIETPFSDRATVDEYLDGNRVVTVSGDRTVIVDYDKQTITEISRGGTYSITKFDELARAIQSERKDVTAAATSADGWDVTDSDRPAGRDRGSYMVARPSKKSQIVEMQIGADPTIQLSREAVEVLLGAAYPQNETLESNVALHAITRRNGGGRQTQALGANANKPETLALPVEQVTTYAIGDNENVVVRNRVTRVGNEPPPPDAITIPAGAKQVPSPAVETRRRLEDLDRFSPPTQ